MNPSTNFKYFMKKLLYNVCVPVCMCVLKYVSVNMRWILLWSAGFLVFNSKCKLDSVFEVGECKCVMDYVVKCRFLGFKLKVEDGWCFWSWWVWMWDGFCCGVQVLGLLSQVEFGDCVWMWVSVYECICVNDDLFSILDI